MNFETTIGLEVHVELKTKSKMFSPAPVTYGQEPNTETNVIDWGFPAFCQASIAVRTNLASWWP